MRGIKKWHWAVKKGGYKCQGLYSGGRGCKGGEVVVVVAIAGNFRGAVGAGFELG